MKIYIYFIFIIIFLFKTGNVLSQNSIFNVDNIEIDTTIYKSENSKLNYAFKKAFERLTKRILMQKDQNSVSKVTLDEIKSIISYYQVINETKDDKDSKPKINIIFDREKLNRFFYLKNISYADISNSQIVIFPILIDEENFYLFEKNIFYTNWNQEKLEHLDKYIDYILPVENLESYQIIKNNLDQLERVDISELVSGYDLKNYIYVIISTSKTNISILIKGTISKQEIVKTLNIKKNLLDDKENYTQVINKIKSEIVEITKSLNLIDLRTPSFLNINLSILNDDDLLNLQKILRQIEIIESFNVSELSNKYVKIKIKYYGKIDKILSKFEEEGIKIKLLNNKWNIELI